MVADHGHQAKVLYGGGVKPSNAAKIAAIGSVDGLLIGGASLKIDDFNEVVRYAQTASCSRIIVCLLLIVMVLLQKKWGASLGLTSGNSSSYFGSTGSGNLLTRLTTVLAICFFTTSLTLGILTASG